MFRSTPDPRISTAFRILGLPFLAALGPYQAAAQVATAPATTDTVKSHPSWAKQMRYGQALAQGLMAENPQSARPPNFARVHATAALKT